MNGSFSYLASCRAHLCLCELRIFLRCSFCSLRWLLLENLPAQLGFSLITPTLVCFCFGSDSWWCVLFEGRVTVAVSAESELFRIFLCLQNVLCFSVGPTEDRYFATNELMLNLILTHCWMSLVLSSGLWFWSWSFVLFGHFYGKNLFFVLASRLILQICSRDGKCLYYDQMKKILLICFEWTYMSPLRRSGFLKNGFRMDDSTLEGLFCFDILHITDVWRYVFLWLFLPVFEALRSQAIGNLQQSYLFPLYVLWKHVLSDELDKNVLILSCLFSQIFLSVVNTCVFVVS